MFDVLSKGLRETSSEEKVNLNSKIIFSFSWDSKVEKRQWIWELRITLAVPLLYIILVMVLEGET